VERKVFLFVWSYDLAQVSLAAYLEEGNVGDPWLKINPRKSQLSTFLSVVGSSSQVGAQVVK